MKKIKYLLFLIPFLFSYNVFAQNVTSSVRCSYNGSGSTYYGDPNDGFNSARCYDIGSRYSPRLGYIEFYLPTSAMSFTAGKSYTVTMNMADNDWRNNIMLQNVRYVNSSGSVITSSSNLPTMTNFRFVSMKQIKFDFKLPSGTIYPYLRFVLSSPTYGNPDPDISSSKYMTGDSNWKLSSIDISPVSSSSSSGSGSGSGSGSSGTTYDDSGIINNNNENTTDIINNNNQNTESIINNQNELLGSDCTNILDITSASVIGSGASNVSYTTSSLQFTGTSTNVNGSNFVIYTLNVDPHTNYYFSLSNGYKVTIFDRNYNDLYSSTSNSFSFNSSGYYTLLLGFFAPYNDTAVYSNVMVSSNNGSFCVYGSKSSKLDDTNKGINDINNNLTDETVPDIDLDLDLDTNSPVSDLLTMPITILNKVFDVTDDTCQPYVLPFDFFGGNNTITFPCINLRNYLGNSVYNILDTILCFFFCYEIGMMCISIYEDITSLRDGFDSLYTPKHGKPLGKHTKEVE